MISSINSMASSMIQIQSASMQQKPVDPLGVFETVDQDDSGDISQSELATLTEGIGQATDYTINAEEAMSTYDLNGDGILSGEELFNLMSENVQPPSPPSMPGQSVSKMDQGMPPPPPPPPILQNQGTQSISISSLQTISEYEKYSDSDKIEELVNYLKNQIIDETI